MSPRGSNTGAQIVNGPLCQSLISKAANISREQVKPTQLRHRTIKKEKEVNSPRTALVRFNTTIEREEKTKIADDIHKAIDAKVYKH